MDIFFSGYAGETHGNKDIRSFSGTALFTKLKCTDPEVRQRIKKAFALCFFFFDSLDNSGWSRRSQCEHSGCLCSFSACRSPADCVATNRETHRAKNFVFKLFLRVKTQQLGRGQMALHFHNLSEDDTQLIPEGGFL